MSDKGSNKLTLHNQLHNADVILLDMIAAINRQTLPDDYD